MAGVDDQLICVYLVVFFFIEIIFDYCFFNVYYLKGNTFQSLKAESIIDT